MKGKHVDYSQFWSQAFDDMEDFVCFIDCDYNLVKANESFFKVFGGEEKLVGKKCFEIFHSLKNPFPGCPHGKMLETKVSEKGEFYEPSLKKYLSVTVTPIWGDDHKFIGSIHIAEDVTQLKEEKEKYRTLVECLQEGIGFVDPDENITFVNQTFAEMLGFKVDDLIGRNLKELTSAEEFEKYRGETAKRKHGEKSCYETIMYCKDGSPRFLNVSAAPLVDHNGNFGGTISVVADVTGVKRAEDAIRKSQKQYADMIDSINDWVWEVDTKGRYTFVSGRVRDVLGYAPEKIIGKTLFDLMPVKEARRVAEIFKQLSAEQKPIRALENINRHKDGHRVFVETSGLPFYDDEGNFKGYRGTDRDVTDRKRAAKLLEFYREYAENIVVHLPVSLIVVNRDLCINFSNQHFLSKMRMTKENVTEKELAKVLGNSVVENSRLTEKIMRVIKGEETRIEGRFSLKSKTYDYMIVPIKEQTGRRLNALLVMEDVTKNVMMEEQLIHSEKLSAVGTFTASVAHEINNPLSIVVGNIQYLLANLHHMNLTRKKEVGEIVETLKTANSEAKRCSEIVTNLLHFSHKGTSAKTKVSVGGVVTSTMRLLAHQLEFSKVKTHIKLADGLPRVMGNADQFQQVFVNLILNAQQVMKDGGKLYVTTSLADNYVTVSFRDTGPGIPKKYIRKIFEPFYSTREAGKGTGLGLFIIHSIMEEHGGKIEVQSKKGQGATFILKLPVAGG